MGVFDHFEIRPAGVSELDALLSVYRQCEDFLALGPQPHASEAMVRADLQHSAEEGGVFCGIYDAHGVMVGVLDYIPAGFQGDARCASLSLLMIAAHQRGKGLGESVVRWVEAEILKDPRVTMLDSGVQVNNPAAIRFWLRRGFEITSGPDLMPDQTTVFHLCKVLRHLPVEI